MTDAYLLTGLTVGVVVLLLYVAIRVGVQRERPDAGEAFRCFVSSLGAATAAKICGIALWDSRLDRLQDSERTYIFLGGLAAMWLTIESIGRVFVGLRKP